MMTLGPLYSVLETGAAPQPLKVTVQFPPLTDKEAKAKLVDQEKRIVELEKTATENAEKLRKIREVLA